LIESNSKMMENVDCYIRSLLLKNKAKERGWVKVKYRR
jgi:hypothetical protein